VNDPAAEIRRYCLEKGADLVGFAPASRWDERGEVPPPYRPASIWPGTRTVIVMGMAMILPIVETTPSVLHLEHYRIVNRRLDELAYDLTRFLNGRGHASTFFVRDGYTSLRAVRRRPAAFGHVRAAYYAGLGTVGMNSCLLTPRFGPRVRFVSVFTSLEIPPDPVMEKEQCIRCETCVRCCPKEAIVPRKDRVVGDFRRDACMDMAEELTRRRVYPCGICTKVCPVGADRKLYPQRGIVKRYLAERETLARDPEAGEYRSWEHIRRHGAPDGERDGA